MTKERVTTEQLEILEELIQWFEIELATSCKSEPTRCDCPRMSKIREKVHETFVRF